MNTEIVQLSQIRVNDANPRTITDAKFHKLVNSILSFPKMLNIRPIAVDAFGVALGGNMRYRSLVFIARLTPLDIRARLEDVSGFKEKTQGEKDLLIDYWTKWLDNPTAEIIMADNLSDAEKREFIIKDNVGFGTWDWDILANEWDDTDLSDWGIDLATFNPADVDDFFEQGHDSEGKEAKNKIILEYPEDEYNMVRDALSKIAPSSEEAVWLLLKLDK